MDRRFHDGGALHGEFAVTIIDLVYRPQGFFIGFFLGQETDLVKIVTETRDGDSDKPHPLPSGFPLSI